jgi:hypothetical protein
MTGQLEQDMKQACATFIAEIERAVTAAIHVAFAQVSTHAIDAVAAPRAKLPALDPLPPRRAPVPASRRAPAPRRAPASRRTPAPASRSTDLAALREQLIGCIRDNPGSTTTRLGRLLGIHTAKLRHQLQKLEAEGALRYEQRPSGFGGQQCRAYLLGEREVAPVAPVVEHTHGEPSAAPSIALGASA